MTSVRHVSICPVSVDVFADDWSNSSLPLKIADSLYFADVSQIIEATTFSPLAPQFYSQPEIDRLKRIRYALVRYFDGTDSVWPSEDEESANQLYGLYLGLKVIRPNAGRYQLFHYDMGQSVPRLPRGSRNDYATILCDCERLNTVQWKDLLELVQLAPSLLSVVRDAKLSVSQAIQSMEIGYRADFLNVRHLLWVVGLDALFTSPEWENQGAKVSVDRIANYLGPNVHVYSDEHLRDLGIVVPACPAFNETLRDIYRLRNHFAHGIWPDKQWAGKVWRRSIDSSRDIYYSEFLSEYASSILRGCLKKILSDKQSVEMFNDKPKINAHFARLGLVRKKKAKCPKP